MLTTRLETPPALAAAEEDAREYAGSVQVELSGKWFLLGLTRIFGEEREGTTQQRHRTRQPRAEYCIPTTQSPMAQSSKSYMPLAWALLAQCSQIFECTRRRSHTPNADGVLQHRHLNNHSHNLSYSSDGATPHCTKNALVSSFDMPSS
jgi:hypothetical protein